MDSGERLRLDYEQTTELVRTLLDVRFKLLAFVPTIAGAAVALVGTGKPTGAELLGVGILGLLSTFGVLIYELRNTQVYNATVSHARALERLLGLGAGGAHTGPAAVLTRPRSRTLPLPGRFPGPGTNPNVGARARVMCTTGHCDPHDTPIEWRAARSCARRPTRAFAPPGIAPRT